MDFEKLSGLNPYRFTNANMVQIIKIINNLVQVELTFFIIKILKIYFKLIFNTFLTNAF